MGTRAVGTENAFIRVVHEAEDSAVGTSKAEVRVLPLPTEPASTPTPIADQQPVDESPPDTGPRTTETPS